MTTPTRRRSAISTTLGLALSCVIAPAALAGPDTDLGLIVTDGHLATAEWDHVAGVIGSPTRVFGGALSVVAGVAFGDEPGYGAPSGTFTAPGAVRFHLTAPIQAWDGSAFVGSSVRLQIEDDAGSFSIWSPQSNLDPASTFELPVGTSQVHQHYSNYLFAADQTSLPGTGVYLASMFVDAPGLNLSASPTFWIVFNFGADEATHEAAIAWANDVLVPAPDLAPALLALPLMVRRRRR